MTPTEITTRRAAIQLELHALNAQARPLYAASFGTGVPLDSEVVAGIQARQLELKREDDGLRAGEVANG